MTLRAISCYEFEELFPNRPFLESYTGQLVEWFANDDNSVLGAIDHERDTWSYVLLKRNQEGELRVVEINENLVSKSAAEAELLRKMESAEAA